MKGIFLKLKVYLNPQQKIFYFALNTENDLAPQAKVGMISLLAFC